MYKKSVSLRKALTPSSATEILALVAILCGLAIAIFIDELPIRLIGVCVSILGGVGHFMLLSQRISESVEFERRPVTQATAFRTITKHDGKSKRVIFDDFDSSFGGDSEQEVASSGLASEEVPIQGLRKPSERPQRDLRSSSKLSGGDKSATISAIRKADVEPLDLDDSDTGFTIVRRTKSQAPATPDASTNAPTNGTIPAASIPDSDATAAQTNVANVQVEPKADPSQGVEQSLSDSQIQDNSRVESGSATEVPAETENLGKGADGQQDTHVPEGEAAAELPSRQQDLSTSYVNQDSVLVTPLPSPVSGTVAGTNAPVLQSFPESTVPDSSGLSVSSEGKKPKTISVISRARVSEKQITELNGHKKSAINIPVTEFLEEAPNGNQVEPRKEFDHLLTRVLMVIRSVTSARTAAFFWYNPAKSHLVLEAHISDVAENLSNNRKFPVGCDIISQIATNGKPEILTEIMESAELDLLPYYAVSSNTQSFIGVPVYYNSAVVGILCADSTEPDSYDEITVGFLGHFTKLITGLVQSYTEKYDLVQAGRALDTIARFRSLIGKPNVSVGDVCSGLIETVSTAIDYLTIGVCTFDRKSGQWILYQLLTRSAEMTNMLAVSIDLEESLLGRTILSGQSAVVNPVPSDMVRLCSGEPSGDGLFFVAVPLKSLSHNYGALFVEGMSGSFIGQDLAILETLGEQTGILIEQLRVQEVLRTTALVSESTGLLNSRAFIDRLAEEVTRAQDFGTPLTLMLVQLDTYKATAQEPDVVDSLRQNTIEHIRKVLRHYDIVGEIPGGLIAVAWVGYHSSKVQILAERLRRDIASSPVTISGRRFSITVSIGLAQAGAGESVDDVIVNASQGLERASVRTNAVVNFD